MAPCCVIFFGIIYQAEGETKRESFELNFAANFVKESSLR